MARCPRLATALVYDPVIWFGDDYYTLLDLGAMSDAKYAEVVGFDRHGHLVLREGEEIDEEITPYFPGAGRSWEDGGGGGGGDAAGTGGQFD